MEPLFPRENVGHGFSENCALDLSLQRLLVISQPGSGSAGSIEGKYVKNKGESFGSGSGSGSREGEHVKNKGENSNYSSSSNSLPPPSPEDRNRGRDNKKKYQELMHSWASVVGRRRDMEDGLTIATSFIKGYDFYGVFDGHGGAKVAHFCHERMHLAVAEEVSGVEEVNWELVMTSSFTKVDREVTAVPGHHNIGSTALVAVVGPKKIVVANCGDCRAVLSSGGVAVPLSVDHKPDRADELERIEAIGGKVINWNGFRVLGVLATSRSIGDNYLKPCVIPNPEVMIVERSEKDEFIILASDGFWDVVSNEVACRVARRYLTQCNSVVAVEPERRNTLNEAATVLSQLAISQGSCDNITVIVVELKRLDLRRPRRTI
ncbi:protein phosphatase 2C 51-like [Dioscorea cayenensis subsp. rotundata]|uniref:protein-serine/threonine phosphatase n=1 Tax=Dioscorea cayennensis subsp. rotundata TaxID=55577 RepID=A0AB40B058_DIOCR|nr:protein phosphatase 2C 51-like [Dioscorea cayenensis subsp. rotundata]